ncbi:MAG: helix-turn-helix transcriptional regulator [Candidatus Eisenbacteria bacterium]
MSKRRQEGPDSDVLVRNWATTHAHGAEINERVIEWHQLAHASRGVLTVFTPAGIWVVPPYRGVWIPAGVRHRIEIAGRTSVRTLYLTPSLARGLPLECRAVNVTPVLRELVLEVCRVGVLRRTNARQARLARVVIDQLRTLSTIPLQLPWPTDPRARQAAELLSADPTARNLMHRVERAVGASRRTLERCFLRETELTLGRWRQRARLLAAVKLLAAGRPVTEVGLSVGYSTPSAFVSAFRRQLGTTPTRYFEPASGRT